MSVSSTRSLSLQLTGDVTAGYKLDSAVNAASPGMNEIKDLSLGNNTITVPTGGSSVPTAVTIVPPEDNEVVLTLKGINGDTGIAIHLTDPLTLSLADSVTSFVLNAADAVEGVRFYWT